MHGLALFALRAYAVRARVAAHCTLVAASLCGCLSFDPVGTVSVPAGDDDAVADPGDADEDLDDGDLFDLDITGDTSDPDEELADADDFDVTDPSTETDDAPDGDEVPDVDEALPCDGLAEGSSCDDHDACTLGDTCADGICAGTAYTCADDHLTCTRAICDGVGGCDQQLGPDTCLIDGTCHVAGTMSTPESCLACRPELAQTAWSTAVDGAACFIGQCRAGACCGGCWDGTSCRSGDQNDACGYYGRLCVDCAQVIRCDSCFGCGPGGGPAPCEMQLGCFSESGLCEFPVSATCCEAPDSTCTLPAGCGP